MTKSERSDHPSLAPPYFVGATNEEQMQGAYDNPFPNNFVQECDPYGQPLVCGADGFFRYPALESYQPHEQMENDEKASMSTQGSYFNGFSL